MFVKAKFDSFWQCFFILQRFVRVFLYEKKHDLPADDEGEFTDKRTLVGKTYDFRCG